MYELLGYSASLEGLVRSAPYQHRPREAKWQQGRSLELAGVREWNELYYNSKLHI